MWTGEVAWFTMAMVGLSTLAETSHLGFLVFKYLGVAYLVWLAWKMWNEPVGQAEDELPRRASGSSMSGAGTALTLGKPKIVIFYLALLPTLIDLSNATFSLWAIVVTDSAAAMLDIISMMACRNFGGCGQ